VIRNASVSARGNAAASTLECCSRGIESIGPLGMRQEWKCRTKMHPAKMRYCRKAAKNYRHPAEGRCASNKCNNYFRYWHKADMQIAE
jgi:hypothetical protein